MKKSTFLIITGIALIGCAYFEANPETNTKAISEAQEKSVLKSYQDNTSDLNDNYYFLELDTAEIKVIDKTSGKVVHSERYDSGSELSKAILKDNQ